MKICYLADADSIHTYRWITYFSKKGHKVSLISFKPPCFDYQGVDIFLIKKIKNSPRTSSHFLNFLPILFQINKLKNQIKPDLFHALSSSKGWFAALLGFKPLIFTIADPGIFSIPFQRKLPKIYKILNRYALKKADLLVCDGENTRKAMIEFGANPQKIKIIRYGVDTEKFKPEKPNQELKNKFFTSDDKIIISVKPLRKECDVESLIRAIPSVLKEVPEAKFLIVGDGEEKEKLISLSKSLGISSAIKFVGWVLSEDLPKYFNIAKIFVCTSLVETGLASSTAEAMACGVPIVVSDSGDNKIFIKDGENGFIFPPRGSEILAEKLIVLLKSESLWQKFYLAHRKWIEENNNYQKEMEKMEKIYKQIINERKN
ncbi:MAG: glycosyltransferase family 4 protein [Patescibacteria group bacterium]|nr:glycosyltransferase family 4 protein [Patescibacteria group bacterium]